MITNTAILTYAIAGQPVSLPPISLSNDPASLTVVEPIINVSLVKSVAQAKDPSGGSLIMPGTVLTYRVVLTVSGAGTATNLAVNDPLPAATSYVPGSITVNGAARTDAVDADNSDFTAGAVNVRFGNTVVAPATHTIEFRVTIN